jgi:hypothetical protein
MSGISAFWKIVLLNYCFSKKAKNSGFTNCSWRKDWIQATFSGSHETTPKIVRIFPNELWDFKLYFGEKNWSQRLLLCNTELNDRNTYFTETVAANLMVNQTVLKDVLGRTDLCRIVRTRRKQSDHSHYVSYVCFISTKPYEFVRQVVTWMRI